MIEGFLKEYLNADAVIAIELYTVGRYFTLISRSGLLWKLMPSSIISEIQNLSLCYWF